MYEAPGVCVDCGRPFIKRAEIQVRCPECQRKHVKEVDKLRWQKKKKAVRESKDINGAAYRNGHPQICEHIKSCLYGGGFSGGCSYFLETGHTRQSVGLFIENGKCAAYKPKGNERPKRQKPPVIYKEKKNE